MVSPAAGIFPIYFNITFERPHLQKKKLMILLILPW